MCFFKNNVSQQQSKTILFFHNLNFRVFQRQNLPDIFVFNNKARIEIGGKCERIILIYLAIYIFLPIINMIRT